jgi:hypothetical protein
MTFRMKDTQHNTIQIAIMLSVIMLNVVAPFQEQILFLFLVVMP